MSNHIEEKVLLGFGDEPCGCNLEPASLRERSDGGYDFLCKNGYPIPQDDNLMPLLISRSLALAGIPTESLPEVKKAWLAANVMRFIGVDMNGGYIRVGYQHEPVDSFFIDDIVNLAKKLRSRGADFGELNALLDSIA